jgi:uncharacterized protein (TIGR02996 family)
MAVRRTTASAWPGPQALGFLRDIIANRDDDAPRLIFADWLDEQGQPERAEFIRVQVEQARLPEDDPQREALQAREDRLMAEFRPTWEEEVPAWVREGCEFRRGFIARVSTTAAHWVRGAAALHRATPLQWLRLNNMGSHALTVVSSPHLAGLPELSLDAIGVRASVTPVRALAASPYLTGLRELELNMSGIGPKGAEGLFQSATFPALTALRLSRAPSQVRLEWGEITDRELEPLAQSTTITRLRLLKLENNCIGPAGARMLADSPNFAGLVELDLGRRPFAARSPGRAIGDEGVSAIAGSKTLRQLRVLDLSEQDIGPAGAAALANSPVAAGLRELHLNLNRLGRDGAQELAASPLLAGLKTLQLATNAIGDLGLTALASSPHLANLTYLEVWANGITDVGLRSLLDSHYLTRLERVGLGQNGCTDPGLIQEFNRRYGFPRSDGQSQKGRAMAKKKTTASEAFLKTIGEEPDEDAHRLVYADWLDDHGQPERAEFIRVQCELEKLGPDDSRRPDLAKRERALYEAHHEAWFDELPEWARPRGYGMFTFRRGFVAQILCTARQWLKGAEALWRLVPPERLILYKCKGVLGALSRSPHLAGVSSLKLHDLTGPAEVGELAAATHLRRLTDFDFSGNRIGDEGLAVLVRLPPLDHLKQLNLSYNNLGAAEGSVGELPSKPALASLEVLDLSHNFLTEGAAAALASSPHLAGLRELDLGRNPLGERGVRRLAASRTLTHLTSLDLSEVGDVGGVGLAALADSPLIEQLTSLRLTESGVGPDGMEALAATRRPTRLTNLDLLDARLSDRGAVALARSPVLSTVHVLGLSNNDIGAEGALALAQSPHLGQLKILRLAGRPIGDEAALALLNAPHLSRLTTLAISREGLSESTLKALRKRFR